MTRPPRPSTSRPENEGNWMDRAIIIVGIAVLFALAASLAFVADQDPGDDSGSQVLTSATALASPPTAFSTPVLPPTITEAVVVTTPATAERVEPSIQVTEPPVFDPVAYVNGLAYCWQCPAPAMEAYRVVATFYGWSDAQINGRATFVQRIMAGESAFCWNARRWTTGTALLMPCGETNPGVHDDVGFGQITNVLRPLTCEKVGICSIADTVASPWNSMLAYVAVLDELGKRPWCYQRNTHVRNGDCATWPG